MVDALDPDDESISDMQCSAAPRYEPPAFLSTDWLETELWNAIMEDTPGSTSEDIDNYDDSLDESLTEVDEEDDEEEQRRLAFTLLVGMRPLLGELLGGPLASEAIPID